jgi:hypothetical protein
MVELLTGNWRSDHLFNLTQHLTMYDTAARQIAVYEAEIQRRMRDITPEGREDLEAPPLASIEKRKTIRKRGQEGKRQTLYRTTGADLTAIDGIGVETAEVIVSQALFINAIRARPGQFHRPKRQTDAFRLRLHQTPPHRVHGHPARCRVEGGDESGDFDARRLSQKVERPCAVFAAAPR